MSKRGKGGEEAQVGAFLILKFIPDGGVREETHLSGCIRTTLALGGVYTADLEKSSMMGGGLSRVINHSIRHELNNIKTWL